MDDTAPPPRQLIPVILAGGQGKRLRPLTSQKNPKPFLRVLGGSSLIQKAVNRVAFCESPIIVCHHDYYAQAAADLKELSVTARHYILEPAHKSTAASIAMAAFSLKPQGHHMLVLPSDHVVNDYAVFAHAVTRAQHAAGDDNMALIGAVASAPKTQYGYISYQGQRDDACYTVTNFVEKPPKHVAQELLGQGQSLWNTGMFVTCPRVYLRLLRQYQPDLYKHCERAFYAAEEAGQVIRPDPYAFSKITPLAVDYAVMEHASDIKLCRLDTQWSDVGTWPMVLKNLTLLARSD